MNRQRSASLVLAVVLVMASGPNRAHNLRADFTLAAITINSTADVAADDGQCTLREAIVAANTDTASGGAPGECAAGNGGDTVDLTGITGTITLTSPLPNVTSDIAFSGPGSSHLTVWRDSLSGNYRILRVDAGATVTISGLTISNGSVMDGVGGGIYNAGTLTVNNSTVRDNNTYGDHCHGGGIHNEGTLTLNASTVRGNNASTDTFYGDGGGIYSVGSDSSVTLNNSTISSNSSNGGGNGGGLWNGDGADMELNNTTVTFNVSYGNGGGIYNSGNSTLALNNSTIGSFNYAFGGSGGGIWNTDNSTVNLKNSIVARNGANSAGPNCYNTATLISLDFNLVGDDSDCAFTPKANDQVDVAPLLGELQDNGGPTETRALLDGSPAIDAIPTGSCTDHRGMAITTDQRGVSRPQGAACDVGAYEVDQNILHLPLVMRSYTPPVTFPLHIGDAIAERAVAYQGEVFYTTSVQIPGQLPPGGHFYFSSQRDAATAALVDDELAVLLDGAEVFAYDFSTSGTPVPAIVEVPRTTMEQLVGRTVTIEYRDVYGSVVEASAMWLIWAQ
jgi:CSLREA domain-containing protein